MGLRYIFCYLFFSLFTTLSHAPLFAIERGYVTHQKSVHGRYSQYIPRQADSSSPLLVIAHGSLEKGKSALELADRFIDRWLNRADEHGVVLVAPAFDRANYQSYGGYRGLFGRKVGADEFVNEIVGELNTKLYRTEKKFFLYGHSAGGQFGVRYAVRHPERLKRVVLSAPGRYAFPSETAPWPYGMGRLRRVIEYNNPVEKQTIDIRPEKIGWVKAAQLPLVIVVGEKDLEPQPRRPGHQGTTRVDLAKNWAIAMHELAHGHGVIGKAEVRIVPGVGHSSKKLTPVCAREFLDRSGKKNERDSAKAVILPSEGLLTGIVKKWLRKLHSSWWLQ